MKLEISNMTSKNKLGRVVMSINKTNLIWSSRLFLIIIKKQQSAQICDKTLWITSKHHVCTHIYLRNSNRLRKKKKNSNPPKAASFC